jgi:hypothetical protein
MRTKRKKSFGLTVVEKEYLKVLMPELREAIRSGEPDRAASFAREAARLQRKKIRLRES